VITFLSSSKKSESETGSKKERNLNKNILEDNWEKIREEAQIWWDKLTDDDLDRSYGKFSILVSLLQERYGYNHKQAAEEVENHVMDFEAKARKIRLMKKRPKKTENFFS